MGGQVGKGKKRKGSNPGVGIDFKKVKHKVGKKLPKAQNDTDTSFKARSINLPSQAVKDDKGGVATNFQNLTLKELLGQTSHYSEKTRKTALAGLGDLFSRHPHELTGHVGLVYSKLVERISDSDEGVRGGLQALLRDHVCKRVTAGQVRPFMPMIMAHVSGATTHLSLEIRNDALVFLDILMDFYPQLIAGGFLLPCLSHFCDLLSSGHRSRSIKGQSLKALLTVLKAICDFLRRAFPASNGQSGGSQPAAPDQLQQQQQQQAVQRLPLFRHRCSWPASQWSNGAPGVPHNALEKPGHTVAGAGAASKPAGQQQQQQGCQSVPEAAQKLLVLLMECWPECSPATLSVNPTLEQATALVLVLSACRLLMDHVLGPGVAGTGAGNAVVGSWQAPPAIGQLLLNGIAPHFPVSMPAVKPNAPVLEQMVQYNLGCSQVLVRLLPASLEHTAGPDGNPAAVLPNWAYALVDFYEGVLRTGQVVPAGGLMSEAQTLSPSGSRQQEQGKDGRATTSVHLAVLTGVEEVLGLVPGDVAGRLVAAVDALAGASVPRSGLRAACLQLQHRLMARWQEGGLYLDALWVAAWLGGLPRLLWELGTSSPATSALALSMLHDAARFTAPTPVTVASTEDAVQAAEASPLQLALQQIQPQLAPLWAVQMPGRKDKQGKGQAGPAGTGRQPVMPGPICQLPVHLQLLASDMLYHLGALHPALLAAALRAVHHQLLPMHCTLRVVETSMHMASRSPPATAASVLLTLLFAAPAFSTATVQSQQAAPGQASSAAKPAQLPSAATMLGSATEWYAQQWQVSSHVLRMAQAVAPASVLLQLLSSQLQQLLQPVLEPAGSQGSVPAAAPAGQDTTTHIIHVHNVLRMCTLALEECAAGQADAVPLPEWLDQALPSLAMWYCLHEAAAAGQAASAVASEQLGLTAVPGITRVHTSAWEDHTSNRLILQLCAAQPRLALPLLEFAAATVGAWRATGTQGNKSMPAQGQAAVHYAALLALARSLLRDGVAKRQLLVQMAAAQAAVERLLSQAGLPGHVTADLACMTAVQQVRHAMDDLVGAGGNV